MWPRLASNFGASVTLDQKLEPRPTKGSVQLDTSLAEWSKDKREVENRICENANLPRAKDTFDSGTWAFQDWVFQRTWSATLSINKARKFGWNGHIDTLIKRLWTASRSSRI